MNESSYNHPLESSLMQSEDLDNDNNHFKDEIKRISNMIKPNSKGVEKKG